MAVLIDSYNDVPYLGDVIVGGFYNYWIGQSFEVSQTKTLYSAKHYIKKWGSPTGNVYAKIYAHAGTYGTSSVPTGTALATSNPIDISSLSSDYQWVEFLFTGENQIELSASTYYVVTVEFSGGSSGNALIKELDASSPTHGGNVSYEDSSGVTTTPFWDLSFEIYGENPDTPVVGEKYPLPAFKNG